MDCCLLAALVLFFGILKIRLECLALLDISSRLVAAGVNGLLQEGDVPAVEEVAVVAISGWVAKSLMLASKSMNQQHRGKKVEMLFSLPIRKYKRLLSLTLCPEMIELIHGVHNLVEQIHQADGMAIWADAVVHEGRIRHVALVVRRVEVLAVPA